MERKEKNISGMIRTDTPLGAIIARTDEAEYGIYIDLRRPDFDEDLELAFIEFSAGNAGSSEEKPYITIYVYGDAAKNGTAGLIVHRDSGDCFCTGCGACPERLFDVVVMTAGSDPKHPGIYIDLHHSETGYDIPLFLIEFSADDADNPNGEPRIAAYIWGDARKEDYSERAVYQHVEEYFRTEETSTEISAGSSRPGCCRREYIDEPFALDRRNFDSSEWAVYCKLAGGLPPDRTKRIVFHVDRIDSWNE